MITWLQTTSCTLSITTDSLSECYIHQLASTDKYINEIFLYTVYFCRYAKFYDLPEPSDDPAHVLNHIAKRLGALMKGILYIEHAWAFDFLWVRAANIQFVSLYIPIVAIVIHCEY